MKPIVPPSRAYTIWGTREDTHTTSIMLLESDGLKNWHECTFSLTFCGCNSFSHCQGKSIEWLGGRWSLLHPNKLQKKVQNDSAHWVFWETGRYRTHFWVPFLPVPKIVWISVLSFTTQSTEYLVFQNPVARRDEAFSLHGRLCSHYLLIKYWLNPFYMLCPSVVGVWRIEGSGDKSVLSSSLSNW